MVAPWDPEKVGSGAYRTVESKNGFTGVASGARNKRKKQLQKPFLSLLEAFYVVFADAAALVAEIVWPRDSRTDAGLGGDKIKQVGEGRAGACHSYDSLGGTRLAGHILMLIILSSQCEVMISVFFQQTIYWQQELSPTSGMVLVL